MVRKFMSPLSTINGRQRPSLQAPLPLLVSSKPCPALTGENNQHKKLFYPFFLQFFF